MRLRERHPQGLAQAGYFAPHHEMQEVCQLLHAASEICLAQMGCRMPARMRLFRRQRCRCVVCFARCVVRFARCVVRFRVARCEPTEYARHHTKLRFLLFVPDNCCQHETSFEASYAHGARTRVRHGHASTPRAVAFEPCMGTLETLVRRRYRDGRKQLFCPAG